MLEISKALPPKAVLGLEAEQLQNSLEGQNTTWFRAIDKHIELEADEGEAWVSGWTCCTSEVRAEPSRPNKRAGQFDASCSIPAICFRAQTHCGYSATVESAQRFSISVLYRSKNRDARTLFSIAGKDKSNILFANENAGRLSVTDRSGTVKIECDAPPESNRHVLLVVSYEPGKLRMRLNDDPVQEAMGHVPGLEGTAELFIGCRNHRPGLAKTLGESRISDLIYWPDRMILGPKDGQSDPDLALLCDFWRWNR